MKYVVTFGEVMGRLSPPGVTRWAQALPGPVQWSFGGAEANVAAGLACLGARAAFVTALPTHPIAEACVRQLRGLGVETRWIVRTDRGRLGLYFAETGANQRPSVVIYDRDHSALAVTPADAYDWAGAFAEADWLHTTGITAAISRAAAEAAGGAMREAKRRGLTVSCDLNFRKKLWRWEPGIAPRDLAERTMRELLPMVDLLIANEEDAADVLRVRAAGTDAEAGRLAVERYPEVAREIVRQFPNLRWVAITLRESISADHNNWGAMLYSAERDAAVFAPMRAGRYAPYEIRDIVDRIGGGDAFGAALIFALRTPELSDATTAAEFAVAASCLAHSIPGDYNLVSRAEVEALMKGSGTGRVQR
ncbi:MAG: sugar kinase [Kiritimatiellae bacterium]|nr:sugar kinase [Kiritimatiellia bacterium]